ncbi:ATPase WRNIP1-like isoform X1 [Schistocerca piceifrons]|uniref:ATPase WRNIP1-like isoform X1 n=2 Tax=Schistocerca piceifrons TaxID=274613 RepID=UPI001F5EFC1E|nr:ATPase WRNIP1-like isoform X1 [Schistocerca piceifrons]
MSEQSENEVNCPVCGKKYPVVEIECHVNKCLFLSSQQSEQSGSKRSSSLQQATPKRHKSSDASSVSKCLISETDFENSKDEACSVFEDIMSSSVPLAEQMRPVDISEFVGQEHVLGSNMILRTLLEKKDIPSMILWGPPGCGKTTLAHIIAQQCKKNQSTRFVKLSATMSGVNEVKEVVKVAKNELTSFKRRTVLFMDEIHRFNKLQQDIFLPHVESGAITLIGATTENPSFSLNSALLSRCRVIVLEKHETKHIIAILQRALKSLQGVIVKTNHVFSVANNKHQPRFFIDEATVTWLAEICDGDARIALNSLQLAVQSKGTDGSSAFVVSLDDIKDGIKRSHILYDKKGEEHYNIISALHKSIRASDDNAALYWLARMIQGGEDPIFIARRLVRAASEDIGLADPMALTMAVSAMHGCQLLGMPECDVLLAQCAVYLARAPKSVEVYRALVRAKQAITDYRGPQPSVPLHLRNAPTRLMKDLGYAKGYNMAHKSISGLHYMPKEMEHVNFFSDK